MGDRCMKITAVYDEDGRIVAAVVDDGRDDSPRPVPRDGMRIGSFEVPSALHDRPLDEICTSMRVDTVACRLAKI
jgi:hypothetical protein